MMMELIGLLITVAMLVLGLLVGSLTERRHFARLNAREAVRRVTITNLRRPPSPETIQHAAMVQGQCVIGSDYFKTFISAWKGLIGGELRAFQSMMTRARREALQRLCDEAEAIGATEVCNVRFESSNIRSVHNKNKGAPQVEVLAYGTAIVRRVDAA